MTKKMNISYSNQSSLPAGSLTFVANKRNDNSGIQSFSFDEVINDFTKASKIRVITYGISNKIDDYLIKNIQNLKSSKDIKIIVAIPSYSYKEKNNKLDKVFLETVDNYLKILSQNSFNVPISIRINNLNHSKIIGTENMIYIGSQNFTYGSQYNYEAGVIIKDKELINLIYSTFFNEVWEISFKISEAHLKTIVEFYEIVKNSKRDIEDIMNRFIGLDESVYKEINTTLPKEAFDSQDDYDFYMRELFCNAINFIESLIETSIVEKELHDELKGNIEKLERKIELITIPDDEEYNEIVDYKSTLLAEINDTKSRINLLNVGYSSDYSYDNIQRDIETRVTGISGSDNPSDYARATLEILDDLKDQANDNKMNKEILNELLVDLLSSIDNWIYEVKELTESIVDNDCKSLMKE